MGKGESREVGAEAATPFLAPACIKFCVCHRVLSNSSHWLSKAEGAVENSELELFFPEGALSLLTFLLSSSLFSRSLLQKPNREEKPDATLITF